MDSKSRLFLAVGMALLALAIALPRFFTTPDNVEGLLYGLAVGTLFGVVLRQRMPNPCDSTTPELRRRYLRELMPAMLAYVASLMLSLWLLKSIETNWLRALVALLPLPPIVLAMRAIVRYIRDTDEMQRQIELEAVSIATALVSLLYLAGGFLQKAKVIDVDTAAAMIWVFPFIAIVYGVAKAVIARRFS